MGGGTLINMCQKFAGLNCFEEIEEKIKDADIGKVDLRLKDITKGSINNLLPPEITIANFGKIDKEASQEDIILGVLNMVFETIGMMGILATQNIPNKNIIVIGSVTKLTYLKNILDRLNKLQNVNFIIPKEAEWSVAIGAILSCQQ